MEPTDRMAPQTSEKSFPVEIGHEVSFSKTVGETDIYLFAGITGDLAPNHVDEVYMQKSAYGGRIAHGALLIGYMSTASTMAVGTANSGNFSETPVSLGYDRVRFLKAVFIGDTITVTYRITDTDAARRRSSSAIEVHNQHGELVAIATHILKWVPNDG